MRIEKGALIAGIPAIQIRNMFRRERQNFIDADVISEDLEVDAQEAKRIFDVLVREGYLQKHESFDSFELSELALRLTTASAAPPIPKDKATKLLDGFLKRVAEINADPSFLYEVKQVILFGSYLDQKVSHVGDVDLAISIDRKPGWTLEKDRRQSQLDFRKGLNVPSGDALLWWQVDKVFKHLKSGQRGIAMHPLEQHVEMLAKVPSVQIWPKA